MSELKPIQFSKEHKQWLYDKFPQYFYYDKQRIKTIPYLPKEHAYCKDPVLCDFQYSHEKLIEIGGERLLVFYLNHCDYVAAAHELGIKVTTLRSHIKSVTKTLLNVGIGPLNFDKICRE
jgi:hypothetical protein